MNSYIVIFNSTVTYCVRELFLGIFLLLLVGFGADFLIDFGFELKAAFQTAAATGNVLRIQRKALLFRHFHVDAVEAVEELRAAERAAAGADAAENGRFIAHADLP